jgi:hypothetical protein
MDPNGPELTEFDVASSQLANLSGNPNAAHFYPGAGGGGWGSAGLSMHLSSGQVGGQNLQVLEHKRGSMSRAALDHAIMSGQAHNVEKMADIHHIHREVSVKRAGQAPERLFSVERLASQGIHNQSLNDPVADGAIIAALASFGGDESAAGRAAPSHGLVATGITEVNVAEFVAGDANGLVGGAQWELPSMIKPVERSRSSVHLQRHHGAAEMRERRASVKIAANPPSPPSPPQTIESVPGGDGGIMFPPGWDGDEHDNVQGPQDISSMAVPSMIGHAPTNAPLPPPPPPPPLPPPPPSSLLPSPSGVAPLPPSLPPSPASPPPFNRATVDPLNPVNMQAI